MGEKINGKSSDANVLDFDKIRRELGEYSGPETLDDSEIIARFLTKFSHPSLNPSSEQVAIYVQSLLTYSSDQDQTEEQNLWRERIMKLMVDADAADDKLYTTWESTDLPFGALNDILHSTKERSNELIPERKALRLLRDLRAGVILREEVEERSDKRWMGLIGLLSSKI